MAFQKLTLTDSLLSSGGSTGDLHKVVVATSGNVLGGYAVVAARGGAWTGILQGNSTEVVSQLIGMEGIARVAAGDSSGGQAVITEGLPLVASSGGRLVPSTAADFHQVGRAMQALTSAIQGVIAVHLTPGALTTG